MIREVISKREKKNTNLIFNNNTLINIYFFLNNFIRIHHFDKIEWVKDVVETSA